MKIFLCWSGPRSHAVAGALNDWINRVIQAVKPFFSPEIEKGAKWSNELDEALEGTRFGIICLTPDNIKSAWIHYEAGALSKSKDALVWTFLHGLTPGDVPPPLGKFQHTVAEKDDVLRLLKTINARLAEVGGEPLQERLLEENFELFWPRLEGALNKAKQLEVAAPTMKSKEVGDKPRDDRAILDEILEIVRSQERRATGSDDRSAPPRRPLYKKVEFLIAKAEVSNADSIAHDVAASLSELLPNATVINESSPDGPRITLSFAEPQSSIQFRRALEVAGTLNGIIIDVWSATLA